MAINHSGTLLIRSKLFKIQSEEKRLVYGVVYEPEFIDSQDDYAKAEEIEKAAHKFLKQFRRMKYMHDQTVESVSVVESYIAPSDLSINGEQVKKGSWVLVTHIADDNLWSQIKSGEIGGYSMGGTARRESN